MNVFLSEGGRDQVPGDLIARWVLRSDLTPVPRTLELTVLAKDGMEERVAVGKSIWTGYELLEYEVVAARKEMVGGVVQDLDQVGGINITALLKSCVGITYVRERAVVLERAMLGEVYRSCGATAAIAEDFQVDRFTCLRGEVPSFQIAQILQEEGAALVLRSGRLSVKRLHDLMAQEPVDRIGQTNSTDGGESEYLERHNIPSFYSTDDTGAIIRGDFSAARGSRFLPRTSARALANATKVLVTRRVVDSELAQQILAGDVLDIEGQRLIVITAAHAMTANDGITETTSRFWMGGMAL